MIDAPSHPALVIFANHCWSSKFVIGRCVIGGGCDCILRNSFHEVVPFCGVIDALERFFHGSLESFVELALRCWLFDWNWPLFGWDVLLTCYRHPLIRLCTWIWCGWGFCNSCTVDILCHLTVASPSWPCWYSLMTSGSLSWTTLVLCPVSYITGSTAPSYSTFTS